MARNSDELTDKFLDDVEKLDRSLHGDTRRFNWIKANKDHTDKFKQPILAGDLYYGISDFEPTRLSIKSLKTLVELNSGVIYRWEQKNLKFRKQNPEFYATLIDAYYPRKYNQ